MPPVKGVKVKSLSALGDLFGLAKTEVKSQPNTIDKSSIYKQHVKKAAQNERFFDSPYYQQRFTKVMSPEEAAIYRSRMHQATLPGETLEIIYRGSEPESMAREIGYLDDLDYKKASARIDDILMKATDPMNSFTMPQDELGIRAWKYNDGVFKNAELANGKHLEMTPEVKAAVRAQALEDAKFNADYVPSGYRKYFSPKGWDYLKYSLLSVPAVVSGDPVLEHMQETGKLLNGGTIKRRITWK